MSSPPRRRAIHLAAYTDSDFVGGGEKALATLLSNLDEQIEVTVVGTSADTVHEVAAGRPNVRTRLVRPVKGKWDVAGMAAHLRAVREIRPDVLQTNGQPWSCQYALGAGVLTRGVKTLAVYHAVIPPISRAQVWRNRQNLKRLDAQVAVSRAGAHAAEEMVGLASGTVRVIHNGVADLPITPLARPVLGPIVGSVGRLAPEKGYDVLLHALQALPDVTAVLVGDGPDRERLERLTHELGLESRLIMPGWQTDPRPWLPTFDVFVLPSRLEALPLAIIEAMLASRPVVASRVGGVPEVVLDERTGLLVRPADPDSLAGALRRLLESPDRREHMGRAGRRLARQNFSVARMVRSFESLYEELVGPTAEPGRSR